MRIGVGVAAAVSMCGFISAANLAAEPVRLADAVLQTWVAGSDFAIDAPLGSVIKVSFAPDGTMTGGAGGMGWALGAANDTGRWWIAADKLCKRWSVWFDAKTRCVEIRTQGEKIFWRDGEGREGTATRTAARSVAPPPAAVAALPREAHGAPKAPPAPQPAPPFAGGTEAAPAVGAVQPGPKAKAATAPPAGAADRAALRLVPPAPLPVTRPRSAPGAPAEWQASVRPPAPDPVPSPAASPPAPSPRGLARARDPLPLLRVVNVQADDVLWVRQGPGTEHEEIGALQPNGRGIELVGPCAGDWCRISYKGLRGWASRHYLMADGLTTATR